MDPASIHLPRRQEGLEHVDGFARPRCDAEFGAIHGRQGELVAEKGSELLLRKWDAEHATAGHGLEELPPEHDQLQRLLHREDGGQAGGGILSHRVPDHRRG